MKVPVLFDHEYQYRDNGLRLNSDNTLPIYDVRSVEGLDLPPIDLREEDVDGRHGALYYAEYVGGRTVVLEGTAYMNPHNLDQELQQLKSTFMPSRTDHRLWFKDPGGPIKYVNGKVSKFNFTKDSRISYGVADFQTIISCGDPRIYSPASKFITTNNTPLTFRNSGNQIYYPHITVKGKYNKLRINGNKNVIFNYNSTDTANVTVVDMFRRSITVNGVPRTELIGTFDWWWYFGVGENNITITALESSGISSIEINAGSAWL